MRRLRLAAILLVVATALLAAVVLLYPVTLGVGSRDQQVFLKSAKPLRSVSYCFHNVDDELRHLAEETADPQLFDWKEVPAPGNELITARVMITSRRGRFIKTTIYHPRQLVVLTGFMDGTRACRVIDVPNGLSKEPVTVDFD
jgi:hypothetical protein